MPRRAILLAVALLAVTAGVLAIVLTGGKDTVPISTVAKAAEATNNSGGFKIAIDGRFNVPQLQRSLPIKGSGALDPKSRRGRLVFESAAGLGVMGGGQGGKVEQIFDGSVIYMKMPAIAKQLGGTKEWLRVDVQKAGQALGIDTSRLGQLGGNDPRQMLDQIRAVSGDIEKAGSEKVRGVDTTRYEAKVDIRKYPDRLPKEQQEQARVAVEQLVDMTGSSTYPMTLWIGDDDLVRRVRIAYDFKTPGQDQKGGFSMQMEFFDYGTALDVSPPPAKDVQDLNDLAAAFQGGAGRTQ